MIASALLLAMAAPGSADRSPPSLSAQYNQCIDRAGGITSNMRDCAEAEGKRQDATLNQIYKQALARLPDDKARLKLRISQRAWLKHRYDHCAKDSEEFEGGTLWLIVMDNCGLAAVQSRIEWLRRYPR